MAEPTNFAQRLVEVLILGEIARDNVCRLGRHTRRPVGVQAQLRVAFSDVSKECAADQSTAAGNNHCSQPCFDCRHCLLGGVHPKLLREPAVVCDYKNREADIGSRSILAHLPRLLEGWKYVLLA